MAITYSDPIITITGGSEETPLTFSDIYDADVGGGWGVVTQHDESIYEINAQLLFGDGAGNEAIFTDTKKTILFKGDNMIHPSSPFKVDDDSVITLGTKDADNRGHDGCNLSVDAVGVTTFLPWQADANSTVNLYGCNFRYIAGTGYFYFNNPSSTTEIIDCVVEDYNLAFYIYNVPSMSFNKVVTCALGAYIGSSGATATDLTLIGTNIIVRAVNTNLTINIVRVIGTSDPYLRTTNRAGCIFNLTDPNFNTHTWSSDNGATVANYIRTFDLNVLDVNGDVIQSATVSIKDVEGTEVGCVDSGAVTNEGLDLTETGVNVDDGTKFAENDIIKIKTEFMLVTGVADNTLTVTRAYYSKYAADRHRTGKIVSKVSNTIPTDASGDIETQLLMAKFMTADGLSATSGTTTDLSPHTITVTKAGYASKTIKYTMDRKREDIEALEKVKDLNYSKKGRLFSMS